MNRLFFALGSILACLGVAAGAFGAHALRSRLAPDRLQTFDLAVRYQLYHAFALLAAAWAGGRWPGRTVEAAGWVFLGGVVVFSGSLYLLAITDRRRWGAVTPIGGIALIAGWILLAVAPFR